MIKYIVVEQNKKKSIQPATLILCWHDKKCYSFLGLNSRQRYVYPSDINSMGQEKRRGRGWTVRNPKEIHTQLRVKY